MVIQELLEFLSDLKANNHKEWFHANKQAYQKVRKEFEQYVALLIAGITRFDDSVKNLEPGASFAAGGVYMPSGPALKAIRNEIYEHTAEFLGILQEPGFKKHFEGLDEIEKLKTAPKGFPKDFEHIELLNHKHYTASKPLSEDLLTSEALTDEVLSAYEALYPLKYFLNEAISRASD